MSTNVNAVIPALLALTLAATACGDSGEAPPAQGSGPASSVPRIASTAVLKIVRPGLGAVVQGPAMDLKVKLTGAKIVPITSTDLKPDEGHLHVILDDKLVSMTTGTELQIPDVSPGRHLIRVEFVAADHGPFDPRVVAVVSFEVKG